MKRILIFGSNDRASLVAARSLSKAGYYVGNLRLEGKTPTYYSKYVKCNLHLGKSYNANSDIFIALLADVIKDWDFILPINDDANEIVYNHLSIISKLCIVLGPSESCYRQASDKYAMLTICQRLNIPVPESKLIEKGLYPDSFDFKFPLYLKPIKSSSITNGFLHKYGVRKVSDLAGLKGFIRENNRFTSIMAQNECAGYGVGVNILACNGVIISYTVHERLHEPKDGGGSSYRKSIELDDKLERYSKLICEYLGIQGVLMIEFKKSGDDYYFMEINTRFWGSLELSLNSGVDFPRGLIQLFDRNELFSQEYIKGMYSRHLLKDFGWLIKELRRSRRKVKHTLSWVYTFRRVLKGKESFDVLKINDPGPFLSQFTLRFLKLINVIYDRTAATILAETYRYKINEKDRILFVCKGNINRSAFAEYSLKKYGYQNVMSCGTLEREGRLASFEMMRISSDIYGLDLSNHRSRFLTDEIFENSNLIFCFDIINYSYLKKRFPSDLSKVFLLGKNSYISGGISDPYGRDKSHYIRVAGEISKYIEGLISKEN